MKADAAAKQAALDAATAKVNVGAAVKQVASVNMGTDQAAKDAANAALATAKTQLAAAISAQKQSNAAAKQTAADAKSARKQSDAAAKNLADA